MSTPSKDTTGTDDDKCKGVTESMVVDDVATSGNESKRDPADDTPVELEVKSDIKEKEENVVSSSESSKVESTNQDSPSPLKVDASTVKDKNTEKNSDIDVNVDTDSQDKDSFKDALSHTGDSDFEYDSYYENTEELLLDSGSEEELKALSGDMGLRYSKEDKSYTEKKYQDSSSDEYEEKWSRPWRTKKQRNKKEKEKKTKPFSLQKRWSERDTEAYRSGYPGKKDDHRQKMNLDFYTNKIRSRPDGDYIDNIHRNWYGDYHRLEAHHGYIQWLFPIRENGMNFHAQELQLHEAQSIRDNRTAKKRVLKSYELMLDFYGIRIKNKETGELERAENWKERFAHLNRSMHNYLRITRILKSLGELGYEHLKAPFVKFILVEALKKKTLDKTVQSCYNYWLETVKDDQEREDLQNYADELLSSDQE